MKKTRILILGGGISGLSLAFYLRRLPNVEVTILEKQARAGGCLYTERIRGFLFERGPRTFSTKRSKPLLQLIADLGLEGELIFSDKAAKKRYLCESGQLRSSSSLLYSLLPALLKEWSVKASYEDESIFSFAARRCGKKVAERLFDPMTLGIYAGDIHELSMRSCFPLLKEWEEKWGSLTRGYLQRSKEADALFSLQGGASTLVDLLSRILGDALHLQEEAQSLSVYPDRVEVHTRAGRLEGDCLFSTLPPHASAPLFAPHDPEIASMLFQIPMKTIHVAAFGYRKRVLRHLGFGYLAASSEKEEVLGAVFDSCIFPRGEETRLSVMVRDDAKKPLQAAREALGRHLNIREEPDFEALWTAERAIPQYLVGHGALVQRLEERMQARFPRCQLLGNYLRGVSVSDCVAGAQDAAHMYKLKRD